MKLVVQKNQILCRCPDPSKKRRLSNVYKYDINFKQVDRERIKEYGVGTNGQSYLEDLNENIFTPEKTSVNMASRMPSSSSIFLSNWERYQMTITIQARI